MSRKSLRKLANNIYRTAGDAIAGEQVIAQARKIGKIIVVSGSSKHRIRQVVLRMNVFCIIDKEFRIKESRMQLK